MYNVFCSPSCYYEYLVSAQVLLGLPQKNSSVFAYFFFLFLMYFFRKTKQNKRFQSQVPKGNWQTEPYWCRSLTNTVHNPEKKQQNKSNFILFWWNFLRAPKTYSADAIIHLAFWLVAIYSPTWMTSNTGNMTLLQPFS